jgi:hypothetical protein
MLYKRFWSNITAKLVAFLLLVSVIPLLLLGIISYNTSRVIIQEEVSDYTLALMVQQREYLELMQAGIESLIANVSGVEGIKNVLNKRVWPPTPKLATSSAGMST